MTHCLMCVGFNWPLIGVHEEYFSGLKYTYPGLSISVEKLTRSKFIDFILMCFKCLAYLYVLMLFLI